MDALQPKDLLRVIATGNWEYNGKRLTAQQIKSLQVQATHLLQSDLYKMISAAIERHAIKIGLLESKDFDDNRTGKALIRTRDVIKTLLQEMSDNKPT